MLLKTALDLFYFFNKANKCEFNFDAVVRIIKVTTMHCNFKLPTVL